MSQNQEISNMIDQYESDIAATKSVIEGERSPRAEVLRAVLPMQEDVVAILRKLLAVTVPEGS